MESCRASIGRAQSVDCSREILSGKRMSKIKVLVIDDEESIIKLVTSYLRPEVDGEQQISN